MHTPPSRYRVAVLGAGMRGRQHCLNFHANADRFELAGYCDKDTPRLAQAVEELRRQPGFPEVPLFSDPAVMLREVKADVFCFATPPSVRLPLVRVGVEAGVRLIAYEKPMALDLAEAAEIDRITRAAGIKTTNAHIHRYGGHWQALKRLLEEGHLGRLESVEASSLGWYLAYATHLMDYLLWYVGAPVESVTGHATGRGRLDDGHHPSPDYVLGRLTFANGVRGLLECGEGAPALADPSLMLWLDAGVTLRGTEGWAQVCTGTGWRAALRGSPNVLGSGAEVFRQVEDGHPYVADLARWLDDDRAFVHPCNGDATYHGFQAVMGVLESAVARQRQRLPLVPPTTPVLERLRQVL